jgi:hypothetical protein
MTNEVLHPRYWLLFGLPWPGGPGPAEASVAFAPPTIPRDDLGGDARDILAVADAYAEGVPSKVVFFSDLTLWLDGHGSDWPGRGTDWEEGKDELLNSPIPALYVTLTQVGHSVLCDASRQGMTLHYPDRTERITPTQRQEFRSALEERLLADWPDYIRRLIDDGKLRRLQ